MRHAIYHVIEYTLVAPYTVDVTFNDQTTQRINFEPILHGEVYGALREQEMFNQVRLDPEIHTLVWPNGADFDPDTLHDWPQRFPALQQIVEKWCDNAVSIAA
jgi:hypothetical protein